MSNNKNKTLDKNTIILKSQEDTLMNKLNPSDAMGRIIHCNTANTSINHDNVKQKKSGLKRFLPFQKKSDLYHFIDNNVRTARYTVLDFIPKQIVFQFSKTANIYFLVTFFSI